MKIEKLTENKIRVILNTEDIPEPNLDTYTMMSKSCKTEGLFFEILQKAEKEVGFYTDGCKLLIEAFSSSEGFLVFTITKYTYKDLQEELDICKKKVKVKRKNINYSTKQSIYAFNNFDEFCSFCNSLKNNYEFNSKDLSKKISLFLYNDIYYLLIKNINTNYKYKKLFHSLALEFGKQIFYSNSFENKLLEHGNIIIKKNAIDTGIKYFV